MLHVMVHVHIAQVNICVKKMIVLYAFKNHLRRILKYIVGVRKIKQFQENYLKAQKLPVHLTVIYVSPNLNRNYIMC